MLMTKKRVDLMLEKDIMAGFIVSLDAATPEIYKIMRPSSDFNTVTRNVAYYTKRAADLGREKSTVTLNMTLCETNIIDAPKLVLLAERLGAKAISFNPMNPGLTHVVTAPDGREWSYEREAVFSDPEKHDILLYEAWQMAQEKGLRMSSHGMPFIGPNAEGFNDIERAMTIVPFSNDGEGQWYSSVHTPFGPCPFPCVKPWQEISIEPNGTVRSCYYHDQSVWSIGNLLQTDAFTIWNSERIVSDRELFLKTGVAPQCRLTAACQHCVHLKK
jgi:MoaA/NifB/PqqE/SkfB family radical SAM enzyme